MSAININSLIDRIKTSIGLNGVLKDVYDDSVIRNSILNVSLPTFNQYHGFYLTVSLQHVFSGYNFYSQQVKRSQGGWDLEVTVPHNIMRQLEEYGSKIKDVYVVPLPVENNWVVRPSLADSMGDLYMNELIRGNKTQPHFQFRAPNTLILKDYARGAIQFVMNYKIILVCTHPATLSTISDGILPYFERLCELQLLQNMQNNELAFVNGYNVGGGDVQVDLEKFKTANSDLREFLVELKRKSGFDNMNIVVQ